MESKLKKIWSRKIAKNSGADHEVMKGISQSMIKTESFFSDEPSLKNKSLLEAYFKAFENLDVESSGHVI